LLSGRPEIRYKWWKVKVTEGAPPAGKHTVSGSGETGALPETIAERLHEQYPAYKDLK
jgi:hypothetical protein